MSSTPSQPTLPSASPSRPPPPPPKPSSPPPTSSPPASSDPAPASPPSQPTVSQSAPPSSSSAAAPAATTTTVAASSTTSVSSIASSTTTSERLPTSTIAPVVPPPVVTRISIATKTPVSTAEPTAPRATSSSFLKNKGALAAVCSVVGLIGLALVFALVTNVIRRRRAKKFDRDVAEAAAEAAKAPVFLDDDPFHDRGGFGGGYGGGYDDGYSGGSHDAYGQPPLQHHNVAPGDTYPMSEIAAMHDGYGAAGVGTLGRNKSLIAQGSSQNSHQGALMRDLPDDAYGGTAGEGGSAYPDFAGGEPYAAFAGPPIAGGAAATGGVQRGLSYRGGSGSGEGDAMDGIAMGTAIGSGPGSTTDPAVNGTRGQPVRTGYSPVLARNKSLGPNNGESYAAHYAPAGGDPFFGGSQQQHQRGKSSMGTPAVSLPNPYSPGGHQEEESDEDDAYDGAQVEQEGEEEHEPEKRVLKVANE